MSGHTAGPWMVYEEMGKCVVTNGELHDNPKARMICECYADGEEQDAEDEANARFVAAGPTMLAALKDLLFELGLNSGRLQPEAPSIVNARAAIAKATQP